MSNPTIRSIRAKLERWELQHLREHCNQLGQRVEDLELDLTRESNNANYWQRQCQNLISDLQDAGQEVGMEVSGELVAFQFDNPHICKTNAATAAATVSEAIEFMEGFRDDHEQPNVVAILGKLIALKADLIGGAA